MFRVPILRYLFILALIATASLPIYTLYILHPSYHEQLISETEEESARFAAYLVRSLGMQGRSLQVENLPEHTMAQVQLLKEDHHLVKLRFFSPHGEIIYSTEATEIGQLNEHDYFREVVARGQIYSKVVRKNARTAEGQPVAINVVETYVPFAAEGQFGGAIEVYYDISERVAKINALTLKTTMTLIVVAAVLMLAISLALRNAANALEERRKAEEALSRANQDLEHRVALRTAELVQANEQLTNEISERTLAQTALTQVLDDLRVDREKLDGILHSVADGILVADGGLNILHMNTAAERMLKLPLDQALGRSVETLPLQAEFRRKLQEHLSAGAHGASFDFEAAADGERTVKVYTARISPLMSMDATETGIILLIQDVTHEREVEQMKNAFLGMAAHELNTPLTNIIGYAELLVTPDTASSFEPNQIREFLQVIYTKACALSRLVDDLLDVSRIEAGKSLKLECRDCVLDEIVHDVIQSYAAQHEKHRFEVALPDGPIVLFADCGRLQQVLHNLISNAIKYSPDGGRIATTLECDAIACRIIVQDEGIGMTSEQLEHIFDRFYRADSSNTAVQGVGLGMSVARHIVEAHRGDIQVESRLGEGSKVTVILPRPSPPIEQV